MPDTDIQTDNKGFNAFLSNSMGAVDSAIKKYVPPDPKGAEEIEKSRKEIKEDESKIAFPTAPPEKQNTDPLQVMGSAAGWIATLGSLLTRQPLTSALNASAGAINAARQGDQQAYEDSMTKWKANDQLIKDQMNFIKDKLENAKSDQELEAQAEYLGIPSLKTFARLGQGKPFVEQLFKQADIYDKKKDAARDAVSEKMEKASYVRDSMEQWQKENPKATKLEQDQKKLEFQNQANEIVKGGGSSNTPAYDWDSYKPADKVPGTGMTYAALKQKAEGLHNGASYPDVGLSMRTTKNPTKDAADDLRAHLYPDDNIASSKLSYSSEKAEETTLGHQTAKLATAGEEFDRLADLALASSEKVDRTQYPTFNKAIEAAESGTGDKDVVALVTNARGAVNTWARAINPNGVATVEATTAGTHLLDVAYSKGQFAEALKQMKAETKAAREAPAAVQKSINEKVSPTKKAPNAAAIKHLKDNPDLKDDFDEYYGKGSSDKYLGAK